MLSTDSGIAGTRNANEIYFLLVRALVDGAVSLERLKAAQIQMIVEVGAYPAAFRCLADDRLI
jgi:hypothetical protein